MNLCVCLRGGKNIASERPSCGLLHPRSRVGRNPSRRLSCVLYRPVNMPVTAASAVHRPVYVSVAVLPLLPTVHRVKSGGNEPGG